MLAAVEELRNLGIRAILKGLLIPEEEEETRAPLTTEWIKSAIFALGAPDGLNPEASAIVFLEPNSGLRPSEAANLLPHRIILDQEVPHVQIRADGRKLKTPWSARDVPLVGMALWVMKLFPKCFPWYGGNEDTLSATVGKMHGKRGMLPTDDHSLYSSVTGSRTS